MERDAAHRYKSVIRTNLKSLATEETVWSVSHLVIASSSWRNNVSFTHKCAKHFISDITFTAFGYVLLHLYGRLAWDSHLYCPPLHGWAWAYTALAAPWRPSWRAVTSLARSQLDWNFLWTCWWDSEAGTGLQGAAAPSLSCLLCREGERERERERDRQTDRQR